MKSMKLGTRLAIGFGLMIVLMGVLVFFGVSRNTDLDSSINEVVNENMVKTRLANSVNDALNVTSVSIRDLVLTLDPAEVKSDEEKLDLASVNVTALLDSIDRMTTDEEGKRLLAGIQSAREAYVTPLRAVRALGVKNTEADNALAVKMIFETLRPTKEAYGKAVNELIAYQTTTASNHGRAASDLASATKSMLMILALIAGLLGILAAWLITRSITRPINQCIDIAEKVAAGDTSVAITVNSNDETGMLLSALKVMVESIKRMATDAAMLSKAAVEGKLSTRADANQHFGDFRKVVQGVNDTLDAVINPINVTAKYVDDISKGIIPPIITENYNGDFNNIKNNLNAVVKMMSELLKESDTLVSAALSGSLSTRANANLFLGGWNQLIAGVNKTLDAVLEPINEAAGILDKVSARDLTARVKGDYKGDHAKIKNSLNLAVENLDTALAQVGDATGQVASASQQISSGSQSLAQGANEQASSLEEVSSSLEEMSSMTKQNADNAMQAKNLAGEADGSAREGTEAMNRMSSAINKIKESSDQTAKIIKTIDEIAMQTNLLALNAAVEAARAGEAGRGFAVVAEEVRNLAQRSAEAAKNTADMIGESVKNADDGVKIAIEVSRSFISIAGGVKKVNDLIGEIAAASKEQATGLEQVNTAVTQMDKVTQQNAANSEESASAAEELSSQAEELQAMVGQFQISHAHARSTNANPMHGARHSPHQIPPLKADFYSPKSQLVKRRISAEEVIPMDDSNLHEF